MEDDVTKVEISKTDITGDNEIEGAKLTITDENGKVVESWISGKEPHILTKNFLFQSFNTPQLSVVKKQK